MISFILALVAAIAIIGYVIPVSLGKNPTRELLTVAIFALLVSCATSNPEAGSGLVNIKITQPADSSR